MHTLFSVIPDLSKILAGAKLRVPFLVIRFWFFFLTRKAGLLSSDMAFVLSYRKKLFRLWLRYPMDIAVLREIYIEKEYDWCPVNNPKTIVDLGAHFGDTTLYYHTRFPHAQIIAVEPAPESYARLIKNTKNIGNITCIQAAIGESNGEINLHIMPSSLGNSVFERVQSTSVVNVPQLTIKSLLAENKIDSVDILKFDIEGAEFNIFNDVETNSKIKSMIGEVHEDLGGATIQKFKSFFTDRDVEIEQLENKKRYIVKIK